MTPHPSALELKKRPGLRKFSRMVENKLFKIYFGGFGLDSLTLKPEIMTIAVCDRRDWDAFINNKQTNSNVEGEVFEVSFSLEAITQWREKKNLLPAARGCLLLAKRHFNQLMRDDLV